MRKAEMVQRIAQELGSTTAKAEAAVEAILTTIKASLQQGEPVSCVALARGRCAPRGRAWAATPRRAPRPPFPPGGWCASSRGTRSSRLSLEPLPPADEPIRRGTLAALKRLECCPAPGRAQRPCSRRAQA